MSERRIALLIDANQSGLPGFLVREGGLNSGFMMAQVTAAALASENKSHAHPASVDSIPTSANQEDHVSMGAHAARKATRVVENVAHVLAIEALCAAQALDFRKPLVAGAGIEAARRALRRRIARLEADRVLAPDIERARALIESSVLREAAEGQVGALV